jgi:hypothetical protein
MAALMTRVEKALMSALIAGAVAFSSAQSSPDFSGHWIAVPDPPAASPGVTTPTPTFGSGLGPDITIVQTPATLTIERAQFSQYDMQPALTFVYALDGSEGRNVVHMGRGPQETTSRASWQNGALVLATTYRVEESPDGKTATSELQQILTLEGSDTLVVAATRRRPGGQPATTSRQTYKKR